MGEDKIIKVAVVEDNKNFRESLQLLLSQDADFSISGIFFSAESALENFPETDLLLLDINLPGLNGIEAISQFKELNPKLCIIMLTILDDDDSIFNAILTGADGYMIKNTDVELLLRSLKEVQNGGSALSPSVARRMIHFFKENNAIKSYDPELSSRELEILQLLVNGLNNKQIANQLSISYETVRNHVKHIYEKCHVHSRAHAVSLALKNKWAK